MKLPKPVYLVLSESPHTLPTGSSRFWGNPDLPEGFDYPMYVDDEGDDYPYYFVCQINLSDLAAFAPDNPLPKSGLLSFFAKIDHSMGLFDAPVGIQSHFSDPEDVKVLYFASIDNMRQVVLVDDNDEQTAPMELAAGFAKKSGPMAMNTHYSPILPTANGRPGNTPTKTGVYCYRSIHLAAVISTSISWTAACSTSSSLPPTLKPKTSAT